MDKFHLMTVFVAVVDSQGFAGAARKLGMSPPAVTRAIHELEAELGLRLLTRSTRSVRVTDAGERYVQDCRRILVDVGEADASVSGMHAAARGRLTITAPVLFGRLHVMPIVSQYLADYPEVSASCVFLDRVVHLLEEGIDVAIRIGDLPDSSMQAIRVGQVRRVICAAPAYLQQHGLPLQPEDLAAHTIISASGVTPTPEWQLIENGKLRSISLQPRLTTTTNDAALAAALDGFGLTRLLSYQVAEYLRDGRLKTLLTSYETAALPVHVVHREGRNAPQRVRAFIDLAVQQLRANPALQSSAG